MMLAIDGVLTSAECAVLRDAAEGLRFEDGRKTAGPHAAMVKNNAQAAASDRRDAILAKVENALKAHPVFAAAVRPRALSRLILSRCRDGQGYGPHVDDALMAGLRTDVSFTLFLSDPGTYDGGALEIEEALETRAVKLPAGGLFLYPATTLHRVAPVTRGERLAVVGWAQSWIRRPDRRDLLFDLDRAVEAIHASEGKSGTFDRVARARSNLVRMWAGD